MALLDHSCSASARCQCGVKLARLTGVRPPKHTNTIAKAKVPVLLPAFLSRPPAHSSTIYVDRHLGDYYGAFESFWPNSSDDSRNFSNYGDCALTAVCKDLERDLNHT